MGDVHKYASDPRISASSNVPYPYTETIAQQWFSQVRIRMNQSSASVFAIMQDEQFCGVISLNDIDTQAQSAAIDYWIAVPFWGQKIAQRAVALCLQQASAQLHMQRFYSGCLRTNIASARVLERNGFIVQDTITLTDGKFKGHEFMRFAAIPFV